MENCSEGTGREKGGSSRKYLFLLVMILLCGLAIRFYDLTDPPLDFHPTRQLGSAIVARGMYYQDREDIPAWQRETAISMWQEREVYEPRILEWVVAQTYKLLGGERLWVARIYVSLAWVLGALGLFQLAKRFSNTGGALVSTIVFLFLPFSILASRSFQPDPVMVSLLVFSLLGLYDWHRDPTWKRTLVAAALGGTAVLIKPVAFFPFAACLAGIVLTTKPVRDAIRNSQVWLIGLLSVVPTLIYSVFLIPERSGGFLAYWTAPFLHLLVSTDFYTGWVQMIQVTVGFDLFILALIGSLLIKKESGRGIIIGMWIGYVLYAAVFPYQIMTHDYYHLMLIPFVAIGAAPLFAFLTDQAGRLKSAYRIFAVAVLASWMFVRVWQVKVDLDQRDYRNETASWSELREAIPRDGEIIALTQAYGYRMQYFAWIDAANWPVTSDMRLEIIKDGGVFDYEAEFKNRTEDFDYFLVTDFN
jgi:hypothetical protein